SLRYTPEILLYSRFPELNRVDHALRFAASWDPTPGLRLFLRDSLLITDNTAIEASPLGIGQAGLQRTIENNLSPGMEVRLGPQDTLLAEYENTIIDQAQDDRRINGGRLGWRHDLPRGGVNVTYDVAYVDREIEGNSFAHAGTVRASYRLNPRNELLLGVGGSFVDNQESKNTAVVGGEVGLNHAFSPKLRMHVTGGVQVFGLQEGNPEPRFSTSSNLEWTFPRGNLMLGVFQGYENTFTTVDDVGVVLNTNGFGSFSYQLGPRLSFSVSGSYGRVEFQEQDETDLVGRATIDFRFQLWQNLFLTAGYNFFNRNSNVADQDLTDHRVFIGLSLGLSARLPL
ncbi:MAG: outer membrane beta-barrel protein, partial [Candidatus Methylomirabilales bacterium]